MSDLTPSSISLTETGDFHIVNHRGRHFWRVSGQYGYSGDGSSVPAELTGKPIPMERAESTDELAMKDWVYYTFGNVLQKSIPLGGLNKEIIKRDGFAILLIMDPLGNVIFATAQARDYAYQGGDATLAKVFI